MGAAALRRPSPPPRPPYAIHVPLADAEPPSEAGAVLQPEVGRRQGGALRARRRGARARDRADRADARRRPRASSSATRSPTAPTGWRWPAATARRRSSPRSPPSTTSPTRASRPAPATTSRSTSASTATTSSARSTRSSTAASAASTSPRSTAGSSSTTSRSGSTPRPSSARATARRRCARSSTRCPTRSAPRASGLDLRWTRAGRPRALLRRRDPGLEQPLPARSRGRLRHPAADRRRPARDHRRRRPDRPGRGRRPAAAAVARMVGARVRGRRRRPDRRRHRRRGAALEPRFASGSGPGVLRCGSPRDHPGASPSAAIPEGLGDGSGRWRAIAASGRRRPPLATDDQRQRRTMDIFEIEQKETLSREEAADAPARRSPTCWRATTTSSSSGAG